MLGDPRPSEAERQDPGWTAALRRHGVWIPGEGALRGLRGDLSTPGAHVRTWMTILERPAAYAPGVLLRAIFALRCLAADLGVIQVADQSIDLRNLLPGWLAGCLHQLVVPASPGAELRTSFVSPDTTEPPPRPFLPSEHQDATLTMMSVARCAYEVVLHLAHAEIPVDESVQMAWELTGWWFDATADARRDAKAIQSMAPPTSLFRSPPHRLDPWLSASDPHDLTLAVVLAALRIAPLTNVSGEGLPDGADLAVLSPIWIQVLQRPWTRVDRDLAATRPTPETWLGPVTTQDLALSNLLHHTPTAWFSIPVSKRLVLLDRLGTDNPPFHDELRVSLVWHTCDHIRRLESVELDALERLVNAHAERVPAPLLLHLRLALLNIGRTLPADDLPRLIASLPPSDLRTWLARDWLALRARGGSGDILAEATSFIELLAAQGHPPTDGIIAVLHVLTLGGVTLDGVIPFLNRWTADPAVRNDPVLFEVLRALGLQGGA